MWAWLEKRLPITGHVDQVFKISTRWTHKWARICNTASLWPQRQSQSCDLGDWHLQFDGNRSRLESHPGGRCYTYGMCFSVQLGWVSNHLKIFTPHSALLSNSDQINNFVGMILHSSKKKSFLFLCCAFLKRDFLSVRVIVKRAVKLLDSKIFKMWKNDILFMQEWKEERLGHVVRCCWTFINLHSPDHQRYQETASFLTTKCSFLLRLVGKLNKSHKLNHV